MKTHKIRVAGKQFLLAPKQDIAALRADIEVAVHKGGGFVFFDTAADLTMSMLVTPYIPVLIEQAEAHTANAPVYLADIIDHDVQGLGRTSSFDADFDGRVSV